MFSVAFDIDFVPEKSVKHSRILNSTAVESFRACFDPSLLSQTNDVDVLVRVFHSQCASILDDVAPTVTRSARKHNSSPWMNEGVYELRRKRRRAERMWRSSKLEVHRLHLKDLTSELNKSVRDARAAYFASLLSRSKNNPRMLFKIINSIVSPPSPPLPVFSKEDCDSFLAFFVNKVMNVRSSIIPSSSPHVTCPVSPPQLCTFSPVTLKNLKDVVSSMKTSSSPFDVLPTSMLKDVLSTVAPNLLTIFNSSLQAGVFPTFFKQAAVQPLLKKPSLDPASLQNYRPISKTSFESKVLEKLVACQLTKHLTSNNIGDKFQSGLRKHHSTETALLRVSNNILMSSDSGRCSVLVLLDLSAAFDTVDHGILLDRLRDWAGVSGTVLQWFSSYLSERSFSVTVGPFSSDPAPLLCGVPQGSVLAPTLFSIYLLPLGHLISTFPGVSYQCYADDIQLHFSFSPENLQSLSILLDCLAAIEGWMSKNLLQLNAAKTEVLIFAPDSVAARVQEHLGPLKTNIHPSVRNLGVHFDQSMHLDQHVKALCRNSFFHLRNVAKLRSIVSQKELEMAVHAFVSSRIDYCCSLYTCLNQSSLHRLQLVQNAAARLLSRSKKSCHMTPILADLHWLPVSFRIHYRLLLITYKALNGLAPSYIRDLLHDYIPSRSLRSSDQGLLAVPPVRLSTKGGRAFEVVAPRLWNSLPQDMREASSVESFRRQLKTHLFRKAFVL